MQAGLWCNKAGDVVLSHRVSSAVPSALRGLTTVFGMGTGVTLAAKPPTKKKTGLERSFESSCLPATGGLCADCVYEDRPHPYGTGQATRAISTARLSVLLRLHLQPINVLVSNGPSEGLPPGKIRLEGGFPLRCFQRFSGPNIATRRCPWQDSRYTRGQSVPVLSY